MPRNWRPSVPAPDQGGQGNGWWPEAGIEGVTGRTIGEDCEGGSDRLSAERLYDKLERVVMPLYATDLAGWRAVMKGAIPHIASHFNSQRTMRRYVAEAYLR